MVDLTDPIGPAARLFEDEFYALCERALRARRLSSSRRPSRSTSTPTSCATASPRCRAGSPAPICCGARSRPIPGAFWTFGIATEGPDPRVVRRRPEIATRLYDVDAHDWFFVPEPVRRKLVGV